MTKSKLGLRYFAVYAPDDEDCAVVLAKTPGQAKAKFINGDVIPYFQGWDYDNYDYTSLRTHRLKLLDQFEPTDSFNILKNLILKDLWSFYAVGGIYKVLNADNYTDERLKQYLKTGDFEDEREN